MHCTRPLTTIAMRQQRASASSIECVVSSTAAWRLARLHRPRVSHHRVIGFTMKHKSRDVQNISLTAMLQAITLPLQAQRYYVEHVWHRYWNRKAQ